MISKTTGEWCLNEHVGDGLYKQVGTEGKFEDLIASMDYDAWLLNREKFPGKTFSSARSKYRRGRLGSHVEQDCVRADRAQDAVGEREALVAGAVVHPVREAG
jgi:hypothetical protein